MDKVGKCLRIIDGNRGGGACRGEWPTVDTTWLLKTICQ